MDLHLNPHHRPNWPRRLAWLLFALAVLAAALWATLRIALAPQTGEWATEIGRGPLRMQASVPQLVWLATSPVLGPALDGMQLRTRAGPVTLGWVPAGAGGPEAVLFLRCEPCTVPLPAGLGQQTLTVPVLMLSLSRAQAQQLSGTLLLNALTPHSEPAIISARWQAHRQGAGWAVAVQWPEVPARDWLALLAPTLPELAVARIEGTVSVRARLRLPELELELAPQLQGLVVSGLGAEAWARARSPCGLQRPVDARSWLVRGVLAAEDQRFYEHPGFDLEELQASLARNQDRDAIRRGGSTISQQLAKLMVAGDERTLQRKLRELLYALDAEQSLGKARILQLYLNLAPWGQTADGRLVCGAEAAARHYYGVSVARLTPRQALSLAAMLHNPRREGERLAREGSVDPDRLLWIAEQVRGVPVRHRRALAATLRLEMDSALLEASGPATTDAVERSSLPQDPERSARL